jgi:ferric-chelate reductase
VRAGRTFWANTLWRRDPAYTQGTLERLSADTVRLTLTRAVSWTAGQHAYLALPSVSGLPTEAHPFTIASAPGALDGTADPAERELSFVIRARGGVTRRMLELAERGTCSVPVLLDGPYGSPPDLAGFSTVMLVAGRSRSVLS